MNEIAETTVLTKLVQIETKLDAMLTGHDDHETRLRALERKVWVAAGLVAIASPVVLEVLKSWIA